MLWINLSTLPMLCMQIPNQACPQISCLSDLSDHLSSSGSARSFALSSMGAETRLRATFLPLTSGSHSGSSVSATFRFLACSFISLILRFLSASCPAVGGATTDEDVSEDVSVTHYCKRRCL